MRFDHDTLSSRIMAVEERRRLFARALHEPDPVVIFRAQLAAFRARASAVHARLASSRLFDRSSASLRDAAHPGEAGVFEPSLAFMREQLAATTAQIETAARGIVESAQRYRAQLAPVRWQVA